MTVKPSDTDLFGLADGTLPESAPGEAAHIELPTSTFGHDLIWAMPSWLLSLIIHVIVLLILAMFYLKAGALDEVREMILATGDEDVLEELADFDQEIVETLDVMTADALVLDSVLEPQELSTDAFNELQTAPQVTLNDFGVYSIAPGDLVTSMGSSSGDGFSGRGEGRARRALRDGGSEGSEKAVSRALAWLAEHQMPDGGWSFDHAACPNCRGQCGNPGTLGSARNGATAMALLPFLGAGQTHREGKYRKVVEGGLKFLVYRMKPNGSLWEDGGRMYSHGLASITLCEAYAMTQDKSLFPPAQASINYIAFAQDKTGGGWRYEEGEPGDTSVVGWQVMALKSAYMANYFQIMPDTIRGASLFLDSVQAKNGARYGYVTPGAKEATTAIGLLCRMHLGWDHNHPALVEGVKFLSDTGPSPDDLYYNYYATQVLRHYEGDMWKAWNDKMRDQLVNSQAFKGHETGSWYVVGNHSTKGGRLYSTSMATMILEVYYRHLPIYRKKSTETEFSLD